MSKCYVLCVEDPCNKQHYSQVAEVRLPVAPTYVRDAVATIHRSNDCAASSVNVVDEPAAADPGAVTLVEESLHVASSNPHLDGEQPSAVTLVQQSLNVASSSPQPTTSRDNSICTPRMPGSLSDKLHYIMQAVDRLEATQNRILQSLESAGIPSNSSESAAEFDMGSKTLPVGSEDDMDHLSQLLENRNKRRQLVRQLFLTRY